MSDDDIFADLLGEQAVDEPSSNSAGSTPLECSGVVGPAAPPPPPGVLNAVQTSKGFICPTCAKTLKTRSTLTRHVFLHTLNDYNARKPIEEEIQSQLMTVFSSVLEEINAEPAIGVMGKEKRDFVEAIRPIVFSQKCVEVAGDLSKPLIDLVLTRSKIVPSAQFEQALQKLNYILAKPSYLPDMWGKLLLCVPEENRKISREVGHRLVWRLSTSMLNKIQEIVFKKMIKNHQTAVSTFSMSEEDHLAFQNHVASLLRAMYRIGAKSVSSAWHVRCQVLRLRFVCGDIGHESFDNRKQWESSSVVLSDSCLNLFLGLERLIQCNKGKTCTAEVLFNSLADVENHAILNEMRQLTRGFLSEDMALSFLHDIVKSYSASSCELEARKTVSQRKTAAVSLRTNLKRNPTQTPASAAASVEAEPPVEPPAEQVETPSTSQQRKGQPASVPIAVQVHEPPPDTARPSTSHRRTRNAQPRQATSRQTRSSARK